MHQEQKAVFQEIRHYLAGRAVGATRDDALLDEVMKVLLVRKHMLLNGGPPDGKGVQSVASAFQAYSQRLAGIPGRPKRIDLDPASIAYVNRSLKGIDLESPQADPVGDLYEAFIGSAIRGSEGQFFTPQNAAQWLVDAVAPTGGERVIDPACGAGGFLVLAAHKSKNAAKIWGIEKDDYLASLAEARMAVLGVANALIYSANSLSFEARDHYLRYEELIGQFDVVLTNPPFGKNIVSVSEAVQREFALGHKWKRAPNGDLRQTNELAKKAPPQVLFVERIISLLRDGGRAGLVLPESVLSNRSYAHVVQYIREHAAVRAVVGMPENLFKHSGKGGTHTKTALLMIEKGKRQSFIFMAEAKWCGNDSRGRRIEKDDLPNLANEYAKFLHGRPLGQAFSLPAANIETNILAPRYHEPAGQIATQHLVETHEMITIGDLIDQGVIDVTSGDEIGKLSYGTGTIPFVRTSDISGWEIKIDPKHGVSQEIYDRLKKKQDVRRGDILIVRDGTYLIGSCALVTEYDEKILYQSHLLKLRVLKPKRLSPYLLLAALSSVPVQRQIKAKTFTQDIIDSLGTRYTEILLPIPKSAEHREQIVSLVEKVITDRIEARELARKAKLLVAPPLGDVDLTELEVAAD